MFCLVDEGAQIESFAGAPREIEEQARILDRAGDLAGWKDVAIETCLETPARRAALLDMLLKVNRLPTEIQNL